MHAKGGLISPEHKLNDVVNYTKLALLKIYHLESIISSKHYREIGIRGRILYIEFDYISLISSAGVPGPVCGPLVTGSKIFYS